MDVIAGNLAMSEVTEDEAGQPNPYRRRFAVFQPETQSGKPGVSVAKIAEDESDFRLKYDPGHKDAIREGPLRGYVRYPNVDPNLEYVDALEATRAYEANLAAFNMSKAMLTSSLKLLA